MQCAVSMLILLITTIFSCSFFHVHAHVSHSDTDLLTVVVFQSEKVQLQINDFDLYNRKKGDHMTKEAEIFP